MGKLPLTMKERQRVYLDILKELDRFCSENNIRYYIGCGTLIGAVRHKGFIPWDDDLDVFIPEPDYNRLVETYKSDDYEINTCFNNNAHTCVFGRLNNKKYYSLIGKYVDVGPGIDLYVIYGAPSDREEQIHHIKSIHEIVKLSRKLVLFRNGLARRNLWPYKTLDFGLMNLLLKKAVKRFRKYPFDKCDYIWPYGGGRLILKKELYGAPVRIQFEDGLFCAPQHYHEVLTAAYGDYMKLPPEDQRHPYHSGEFYLCEGKNN